MSRYCAIIPVRGDLRRIFFDADSVEDARLVATSCNAGLQGEAFTPNPAPAPVDPPFAYDQTKARELLGGISRATLYNWLAVGRLERVPDTRRVLITRSSLERAVSG
jgi:hypothetical protein